MKKLLLAAAIIAATTTTASAVNTTNAPEASGLYPKSAAVINLDFGTDFVTLEDSAGRRFEFNGCEDWALGDIADLLIWDNGTPDNILDDVILSVRYSGYLTADFK